MPIIISLQNVHEVIAKVKWCSFFAPQCSMCFWTGDNRAFTVDISESAESMQNLFSDVQKAFSQTPSCIVNCAGITQDSFLLKMDEKDFDQVVQVNLKVSGVSLFVSCCFNFLGFALIVN